MAQALVNLPTVKIVSGHKALTMIERYAHASAAHVQASLDRLDARYRSDIPTLASPAESGTGEPEQPSTHG